MAGTVLFESTHLPKITGIPSIVEAAETMTYTHVKGAYPAKLKAFWPTYQYEDNTEPPRNHYTPDAAAISRADEVFDDWFPKVSEQSRPLLCSWALLHPKNSGGFRNIAKKTNKTVGRQNGKLLKQ